MAQQDTTGWLHDAVLSVRPGSAAAGSGSGGFSLRPDEAEEMLVIVRAILSDIQGLRNSSWRIAQSGPSPEDPASRSYHDQLTWPGSGALAVGEAHLNQEDAYLSELAQKLQAALEATQESDDQASSEVIDAAEGEGGLF